MDQPQLSDHFTTVAPYCVWITYRLEAGATQTTGEAAVSGYRVLPNGVVGMDAASITLHSANPFGANPFDADAAPDWLTGLIEKYAQSSWQPPPEPPAARQGFAHSTGQRAPDQGDMSMELASSANTGIIGVLGIVVGFRLQERSTARRDRHARQAQQRAELRTVSVRFLAPLAAARRLQNACSVLREAGAPEAEQAAAKQTALEARTSVDEVLAELPLLVGGPRVLELAGTLGDVTFTLLLNTAQGLRFRPAISGPATQAGRAGSARVSS
ncbi:hypothetical protein AB0D14_36960 [Streptomyces sp. NPDC048484]|uniref:hypothetical protein n=1 Tax=Streptomyces sp. NPDC048484 TaxID=3155146 RepID=UPI0034216DAA